MAFRPLVPGEIVIMRTLLERVNEPLWRAVNVEALRVSNMNDGGMGSLLFETTKPDRRYGRTLSERWFKDEDGWPVLVAINLDKEDEIFELDSWKVDFSPRRRLPESAAELISAPPNWGRWVTESGRQLRDVPRKETHHRSMWIQKEYR